MHMHMHMHMHIQLHQVDMQHREEVEELASKLRGVD